ncbi:MAG TPA: antibiotic biosynthesis monooxygenase [Sphingomonadaceae bacterium]|nr:antibiotic biosynthesis monooxygenase [Sphingomonadaceae bacterium]
MYLNVFRSRKREGYDADAYAEESARMVALAQQQPGFLAYKSYAAEDGESVTISEWEDEASALAWRGIAEHKVAQAHGRSAYYSEYTMFVCVDPRVHRFTAKDGE